MKYKNYNIVIQEKSNINIQTRFINYEFTSIKYRLYSFHKKRGREQNISLSLIQAQSHQIIFIRLTTTFCVMFLNIHIPAKHPRGSCV